MTLPPGGRPAAVRRPEPARTLRVLLVCQANVCRSRAASVLLRDLAAAAQVRVSIRSAGIRVNPRAPRCDLMASVLTARGVELFADRPARPLDADLLARSDLVLVAESRHRAHAARLLPASRTRTFTVLEAAALADALRAGSVRSPFAPSRADDLTAVVEALHAARGRVGLNPSPSAWARWRRSAPDPAAVLDLGDVHTEGRRAHKRTVARLDGALASVVDLLAARGANV